MKAEKGCLLSSVTVYDRQFPQSLEGMKACFELFFRIWVQSPIANVFTLMIISK